MAGNTEGAVPISSVETDISSLSVKPGSSASLLEPAPSPVPRVADPFAGVAGRSFFYLGLWVERYMAWRQRVPRTRAYRDLAELLQPATVACSSAASIASHSDSGAGNFRDRGDWTAPGATCRRLRIDGGLDHRSSN